MERVVVSFLFFSLSFLSLFREEEDEREQRSFRRVLSFQLNQRERKRERERRENRIGIDIIIIAMTPEEDDFDDDDDDTRNTTTVSSNNDTTTTAGGGALARKLTQVARDCLQSLNPLHAVLCLEATFQNDEAKFPVGSIEDAKNRVLLGTILNAVTDNQLEAKRHLERGKLVLKNHARYEDVKYETFRQLALANQIIAGGGGGQQQQQHVGNRGNKETFTTNNKAKRTEEEALNTCLEVTRRMRDDASGAVTKTERDEWRARVVWTHVALGEMHLRNENFAMSEKNFGLAFGAVEDVERELVKRKTSGRKKDAEEELALKEEKEGLTRLKLNVALADFERAILQRANGEEPSRVSKAMKKAEAIAKDVHAMDEHARELFQFSSLRCASKIEEGDIASALKGANDLRKRCDYHKERMKRHLVETSFVERILVKAGLIEWKKKNNNSSSINTKKSAFAKLDEAAREWIPERQVIARAEILLAETSRKSGSTKETTQRLQEVKKMLDEALEELGISALGLPYQKGGDAEIAETNATVKKRHQNDDEEEEGEKMEDDKDKEEEEMDVDDKEEEEEETPTTTRSSRRSTRGNAKSEAKSTPRSKSKPSKKIPATESTRKKRAAKTKEIVVQKRPPPQQQQRKHERLWVMKEENLGPRSSCDALPLFTLRCNCNELLASMYLTAGDYPRAVIEVNEMDAIVSTYPQTLSSLVAHCEMVRGHALHSMGKYRDAVKAFTKAAERAKTPSFRDLATLCAALGELATGGTKGASKALDLAQPICRRHEDFLQNEEEKNKRKKRREEVNNDDDDETSFRPSLTDGAVALFVSGFAFLERGNQDGAKSRLSSALKLAHAKTKDTQLVAACLRALGSIASERSASNEQQQALDMLQSAFTLSKAQDDLDGQVEALRRLVESHEKKGSSEKEKKTLSDYLQKKENQMKDDLGKLSKEENKNNVVLLEKGLKDLMK